MNDQLKENDIFVSSIINPASSVQDLLLSGYDVSNTGLLTPEAYKNSPVVLKMFTDANGIFDNNAFDALYKKAQEQYKELSDRGIFDGIDKFLKYNENDFYKPKEADTFDKTATIQSIYNPNLDNQGISAVYGQDVSTLSDREKAQKGLVWDTDRGQWMDKTAEELGVIGVLTQPGGLVYAQWDSDGEHIDPFDGQLKAHRKNEFKVNEFGTYYTETGSGKENYGKLFVAISDVITKEGSWLNKYDFMDSDDLNKSTAGIIAKTLVQTLPYFIPGVGKYLGAASAAFTLAGSMPTLIKAAEGIVDNSNESNATRTVMNKWENWFKQFDVSHSDYGNQHAWGLENMSDMIANSVVLFRQIQAANKTAGWLNKKLKKDPSQKFGKLLKKLTQEYLDNAIAEGYSVNPKALSDGIQRAVLGIPEMKSYIDSLSNTSRRLTMGYMAILLGKDVYEEALESGFDRRSAGLSMFGAIAAQYAVMMNEGMLTTWMLGDDEFNPATNKLFLKLFLKDEARLALKTVGKIAAASGTVEKTKEMGNFLAKSKNLLKDFWYKDYTGTGLKAILMNSLREGTEEVIEEATNDALKAMINVLTEFGFGGKEAGFDFKNQIEDGSMLQRYLLNFVGGAAGGAVFQGMQTVEKFFTNRTHNIKTPDIKYSIIQLVMDGRTQEALDLIDEMDIGADSISFSSDTANGADIVSSLPGDVSMNDAIKNILRLDILRIDAILGQSDLKLNDEAKMSRIIRDVVVAQAMQDSGIDKLIVKDVNTLITKYVNAESELRERLENKDNEKEKEKESEEKSTEDKIKDAELREGVPNSNLTTDQLKARRDRYQKELADIFSGKKTKNYYTASVINSTPVLRDSLAGTTFNDFLTAEYGSMSIEAIKNKFGYSESNLQEQYKLWKDKNFDQERFLGIGLNFELFREKYAPIYKEYVEDYAKLRNNSFASLLRSFAVNESGDQLPLNLFLSSIYDVTHKDMKPEEAASMERIYKITESMYNADAGLSKLNFGYLVSRNQEATKNWIHNVMKPVIDIIAADTAIGGNVQLRSEEILDEMYYTLSHVLNQVPMEQFSVELSRSIFLQLFERFKPLFIEAFASLVNKASLDSTNSNYNPFLLKYNEDFSSFFDTNINNDIFNNPEALVFLLSNILNSPHLSIEITETGLDNIKKELAENTAWGQLFILDQPVIAYDLHYSTLLDYINNNDILDGEFVSEFKVLALQTIKAISRNVIGIINKSDSISEEQKISIINQFNSDISNNLGRSFDNLIIALETANFNTDELQQIKDIQDSVKDILNTYKSLSNKKIHENAFLDFLYKFEQRMGQDSSIDTIKNVLSSVLDIVNNVSNLQLIQISDNLLAKLKDLLQVLNIAKAVVLTSSENEAPSLSNLMSYQYMLKRLEEFNGEKITYFDLSIEDANLLMREISIVEDRIKGVLSLINRMDDVKNRLSTEQYQGYVNGMVDGLIGKNIKFNLVAILPPDDKKPDESNEEYLNRIAINIFNIAKELDEEELQKQLRILTDELLKDEDVTSFLAHKLKSSDLSTEFKPSNTDVLLFILQSVAEHSSHFNVKLKKYINQENALIPYPVLELGAKMVSAYLHNSLVFETVSEHISKKFKTVFSFTDAIFVNGIAGSGKTSVIVALALFDSNKSVLIGAPGSNQVKSLKRALNGISVKNELTISEILQAGLSEENYKLYQHDNTLARPDGSMGTELLNEINKQLNPKISKVEENNGSYSQKLKISKDLLDIEKLRRVFNGVDVLVIDEATNLSSLDQQLLQLYKEVLKEDGKDLQIILIGDLLLNTNSALGGLNPFTDCINFTTLNLLTSVRANNTSKRQCIQNIGTVINNIIAKHAQVANETSFASITEKSPVAPTVVYYEDANVLEGDKWLINNSNDQLAQLYKALIEKNRIRNERLGVSDKIMIIAQLDNDGNISGELAAILALAGITTEEYFAVSPESYGNYPLMQGAEAAYVIVHDFSKNFKDKPIIPKLLELNTVTTRSLEGSIVNWKTTVDITPAIQKASTSGREDSNNKIGNAEFRKKNKLLTLSKLIAQEEYVAPTVKEAEENKPAKKETTKEPKKKTVETKQTKKETKNNNVPEKKKPKKSKNISEETVEEDDLDMGAIGADTSSNTNLETETVKTNGIIYMDPQSLPLVKIYTAQSSVHVHRSSDTGGFYASKSPALYLDLNGLGNPNKIDDKPIYFSSKAEEGNLHLKKFFLGLQSILQAENVLDDYSLEVKISIIRYFELLPGLSSIIGHPSETEEAIEEAFAICKSIILESLTNNPNLLLYCYKTMDGRDKWIDHRTLSSTFSKNGKDYNLSLVYRLRSTLYNIDLCIEVGLLPSIQTASSLDAHTLLYNSFLTNIINSIKLDYTLFQTGLNVFNLFSTEENGRPIIVGKQNLASKYEDNTNAMLSLHDLIVGGATIEDAYPWIMLSDELVTYNIHSLDVLLNKTEELAKYADIEKAQVEKEIKSGKLNIPVGVFDLAFYNALLDAKRRGITDEVEIWLLVDANVYKYSKRYVNKNGVFTANGKALCTIRAEASNPKTVGAYVMTGALSSTFLILYNLKNNTNSEITKKILTRIDCESQAKTIVSILERILNESGESLFFEEGEDGTWNIKKDGDEYPILNVFNAILEKLLEINAKTEGAKSDENIISDLIDAILNGDCTTSNDIYNYLYNETSKIKNLAFSVFCENLLDKPVKGEWSLSINGVKQGKSFKIGDREVVRALKPISAPLTDYFSAIGFTTNYTPLTKGKAAYHHLPLVIKFNPESSERGVGSRLAAANIKIYGLLRYIPLNKLTQELKVQVTDFHTDELGEKYEPSDEYLNSLYKGHSLDPIVPKNGLANWESDRKQVLANLLNEKGEASKVEIIIDPLYPASQSVEDRKPARKLLPFNCRFSDTKINNASSEKFYEYTIDGVGVIKSGYRVGDIIKIYDNGKFYRIIKIGKIYNGVYSMTVAEEDEKKIDRSWSEVQQLINDAYSDNPSIDNPYAKKHVLTKEEQFAITQRVVSFAHDAKEISGDSAFRARETRIVQAQKMAKRGISISLPNVSDPYVNMDQLDVDLIVDKLVELGITPETEADALKKTLRETAGSKYLLDMLPELTGDYSLGDYLYMLVPYKSSTATSEKGKSYATHAFDTQHAIIATNQKGFISALEQLRTKSNGYAGVSVVKLNLKAFSTFALVDKANHKWGLKNEDGNLYDWLIGKDDKGNSVDYISILDLNDNIRDLYGDENVGTFLNTTDVNLVQSEHKKDPKKSLTVQEYIKDALTGYSFITTLDEWLKNQLEYEDKKKKRVYNKQFSSNRSTLSYVNISFSTTNDYLESKKAIIDKAELPNLLKDYSTKFGFIKSYSDFGYIPDIYKNSSKFVVVQENGGWNVYATYNAFVERGKSLPKEYLIDIKPLQKNMPKYVVKLDAKRLQDGKIVIDKAYQIQDIGSRTNKSGSTYNVFITNVMDEDGVSPTNEELTLGLEGVYYNQLVYRVFNTEEEYKKFIEQVNLNRLNDSLHSSADKKFKTQQVRKKTSSNKSQLKKVESKVDTSEPSVNIALIAQNTSGNDLFIAELRKKYNGLEKLLVHQLLRVYSNLKNHCSQETFAECFDNYFANKGFEPNDPNSVEWTNLLSKPALKAQINKLKQILDEKC